LGSLFQNICPDFISKSRYRPTLYTTQLNNKLEIRINKSVTKFLQFVVPFRTNSAVFPAAPYVSYFIGTTLLLAKIKLE